MAGKRRKKQQRKWKKQLTYELLGLFLLIISLITFARLGIVGEGLVRLFRFFLSWLAYRTYNRVIYFLPLHYGEKKDSVFMDKKADRDLFTHLFIHFAQPCKFISPAVEPRGICWQLCNQEYVASVLDADTGAGSNWWNRRRHGRSSWICADTFPVFFRGDNRLCCRINSDCTRTYNRKVVYGRH